MTSKWEKDRGVVFWKSRVRSRAERGKEHRPSTSLEKERWKGKREKHKEDKRKLKEKKRRKKKKKEKKKRERAKGRFIA